MSNDIHPLGPPPSRTRERAGVAIADLFQRYLDEFQDGTNDDPHAGAADFTNDTHKNLGDNGGDE